MPEPAITELNAGESSRASHVWRVDLPTGPQIYRRSWWTSPEVSAFMLGLSKLFGVDPRDLHATAEAYRFWGSLEVWAVPQPLGLVEFRGTPALRVEFVEGESGTFEAVEARELGRKVARIHTHTADFFGDVNGKTRQPIKEFYPRALQAIREVAPSYQPAKWQAHWAEVEKIFAAAPPPSFAVPMLLDWNESQFVWRGGFPFALVDVEASAFAPPELDLAFWEVLLSAAQAQDFAAGYREICPLPDLFSVRAACRLILLALESEGSPPLEKWLGLPAHFTALSPHSFLRLDAPEAQPMSNVFYRSSKTYPVAQKAEGVYIWDTTGKRYLDGSSGALVANIGHGRQAVAQAMAAQALKLEFVHGSQFSSEVLEEYASRLAQFLDLPDYRFWAVSGGSEANESAIKLARQYHVERGQPERFKIITRIPSYHGASLGALAASGMGARRELYTPLMRGDAWPKMPKPDPQLSGEEDAERLRAVIEQAGPETVAAFMCEPVVGASDAALAPNAGYHARIAEICREYGILFISDEVMAGMGRCGAPLAVRLHEQVTPDIVVLGKGLAAGYAPLAGLMAAPQLYDTVMGGSGAFKHGFTYAGHPVSVAAGLSVLDIVESEHLVGAARERGAQLLAGLQELQRQHPQVLEVRGQGLLLGVVLGDPTTRQAMHKAGLADQVAARARELGLLTYPGTGAVDGVRGDHLLLGPPLSITADEVGEMLGLLADALKVEG